jgi:hypothetical protein
LRLTWYGLLAHPHERALNLRRESGQRQAAEDNFFFAGLALSGIEHIFHRPPTFF